jgi:hypothetical protein
MSLSPANTLPWQHYAHALAEHAAVSPLAQWYLHNEFLSFDPQRERVPIWLASPDILSHSHLLSWQQVQLANGECIGIELCEKIASNRSWVDATTLHFLQQMPLRISGQWLDGAARQHFKVRALWPECWHLPRNLNSTSFNLSTQLKTDLHDAQAPFSVTRLWQTAACRDQDYVLGLMLNGAQGDDDEAHGGHFAVVLGQLRERGEIGDLIVANYYNPDVVSEKGILPAMTPLAHYLADLNSGQQYYRPSAMLCIRLKSAELLKQLYSELELQMDAMYRHQWHYDHAFMNCTGISMDALRSTGLRVPHDGNSAWLAPLAGALTLLRERDTVRAKRVLRYLCSERTRLFPGVAWLKSSAHILSLIMQRRAPNSVFEQQLCANALACDYIHFPQIPSTRASGREPLFSLRDYRERMPANRADWKIIPVQARPFPRQF